MIRSTDDNLFDDDAKTDAERFLYDGHDFNPEGGGKRDITEKKRWQEPFCDTRGPIR